ncbi:MAG: UDP-N-acetylmuramoyl-tripeptide--D-alanyl-D-alanine ligase [Varibaculum sp.]|nr:UDP-N-acetylmuramoyl-tripeptide--D-alanyl-D-alanine ligase [Varibaculum sp.]
MSWTSTWIAKAVHGTLRGENTVISGSVSTDSRQIGPGDLYVARTGQNSDGHQYLAQAQAAGATAALVSEASAVPEGFSAVVVDDTTRALGVFAHAHLKTLSAKVLGITGSVGKTTTKDQLAAICAAQGETVAPEKSYNNEVGVPLTVLRAGSDTRYLVLEMGTSGMGELAYLTSIAPLDIGIELKVGTAHLGGFGSITNLASAKAELLAGIKKGGVAILNHDDPYIREMKYEGERLYFGAGTDYRVLRSGSDSQGHLELLLSLAGEEYELHSGLVGEHNAVNLLAAITAAAAAGIDTQSAVDALQGRGPVSDHRMKVQLVGDIKVIDDSYNANPDSMRSGLDALAVLAKHRKVAVLGSMLELGEQEVQLHREIGTYIDRLGIDLLITVGHPADEIAAGAVKTPSVSAESADEAITIIRDSIGPSDTVLLKGSNASGVYRIADTFLTEVA